MVSSLNSVKKTGVFEWKGYKIGVEICSDHGHGTLRKRDKIKDLDFQFILSRGMTVFDRFAAIKKGGYIVKCDGHDKHPTIHTSTARGVDSMMSISDGIEVPSIIKSPTNWYAPMKEDLIPDRD